MSEVMAQRQLLKPTYAIPIIPVTNSSSFKHQEAMELKEYKVKVSHVNNRVTVHAVKCTKCTILGLEEGGSFLELAIGKQSCK